MFRIFGPPGTGKTTTLLNMVDNALSSGIRPDEIAFLAFTRRAATEARERAAARFGLDPKKDLVNFRTLHSLAYRSMGIRETMLMQRQHYAELSNRLGLDMATQVEDNEIGLVTTDHPILSLVNLARLRKVSVRRQYDESALSEPWALVDYVARGYAAYRAANNLLDYTDMLEMFARTATDRCPRFKLTFLDEAQDLSPLQWDIAHAIDEISDRMYVAGDDDQAIYRWAGADVDHFINLPGGSEVLRQSYRIPSRVHALAESVSRRIRARFPKTYLPRDEAGTVERVDGIDQIDMSHGSWLVLTQANYMSSPLASDLRDRGILFERNGHRSIPLDVSLAVTGWERMRKGQEISLDMARSVYSFMTGNGKRIARGRKTISAPDDSSFTMEDLQKNHGLLVGREMIWHEALDRLPDVDKTYVIAMLRRGEKFNATPRVRISTIHGAKGSEADNVILFPDLSPIAAREASDDIHRLFYVGLTRARKALYIPLPQDTARSYEI